MVELTGDWQNLDRGLLRDRAGDIMDHLHLTGQVTIMLGSEEYARRLNEKFRRINQPTDVLSFPMEEETPAGSVLGDIFICRSVAAKRSETDGIPLEQEIWTLMIHGLLHLAGYDHEQDDGEMEALQTELLSRFPLPGRNRMKGP